MSPERKVVYSRTQKAPVELIDGRPIDSQDSVRENGSIVNFVLRNKGINDLDELVFGSRETGGREVQERENLLPAWVIKDLILVDSLETTQDLKLKIFAFRLWLPDASYDHIKEFLPEEAVRIDDLDQIIDDVIMGVGDLGSLYDELTMIEELADEIFSTFKIARYKLLVDIISDMVKEGFSRDHVIDRTQLILEELIKREENYYKSKKKRKPDTTQIVEKIDIISSDKEQGIKRTEDPSLAEIERLFNEGKSRSEIVEITGYTKDKVTKALTALRIEKRISSRDGRDEVDKDFIEFVLEVERIRNENQESPPTYLEIAAETNSSYSRVHYAVIILGLLGRTTALDSRLVAMRREDVGNNESKIRKFLREYKKLHPLEHVTRCQIKIGAGVDVNLDTITLYYRRIARDESVPFLLSGSRERAESILIEETRMHIGEPLVLSKLAKKYNIRESILASVYKEKRDDIDGLISFRDHINVKRKELLESLREHLKTEDSPYNLQQHAISMGINPGTALLWYWRFARVESMPRLSASNSSLFKE